MSNKPKSSELNSGPGFRIKKSIERFDTSLLERFARFETPDISDMLNRMYTFDAGIKNLTGNKPLIGPAITVKLFPGDNLMVHKTLDIAEPGDIVVVDTCGSTRNAVLGDLVANKALKVGIAGFIIDGLIRDLDGIIETGLPIYARGITPLGPLHRGPGEINFPISCGGVVVNPGDIIVADRNGIVDIKHNFAEDLIVRLESHREIMSQYVENVKKGIFNNKWVDEILEEHECEYND